MPDEASAAAVPSVATSRAPVDISWSRTSRSHRSPDSAPAHSDARAKPATGSLLGRVRATRGGGVKPGEVVKRSVGGLRGDFLPLTSGKTIRYTVLSAETRLAPGEEPGRLLGGLCLASLSASLSRSHPVFSRCSCCGTMAPTRIDGSGTARWAAPGVSFVSPDGPTFGPGRNGGARPKLRP